MKISQLKSLIKESIKEVLKENSSVSNGNVSPLTIDDWDLYNQKKKYFKGDTNLADSWLELFSDEPLNVNYRKLANEFLSNNNLNWRVVKKLSQNDEGEITWEIAPAMQERRKMSLKENGSLDPKLAGYWVLKNNTQAISMYPSKQEAEMAFKNRGTKYGSHALNSGWKIVPAEEFISTGGLLDKHTTGHPNYVSPYRRPNKQQDRFDNIARSNREMER